MPVGVEGAGAVPFDLAPTVCTGRRSAYEEPRGRLSGQIVDRFRQPAPKSRGAWFTRVVSTNSSTPRVSLTGRLNAGIALTFFIGVVFNLAQAVTGDQGWPVNQPWLAIRLTVGLLFVLLVLARLAMWIATRTASRRAQSS